MIELDMPGKSENLSQKLCDIYDRLLECYGRQHWWPGETPFEVMVGAILTQSAAWSNVEKAITNLKIAGALSPRALRDLPEPKLAILIRPSGYYNAKARKLKAMAEWLWEYDDDLDLAFDKDIKTLREELLSVHGIGEETADSVILYAAGKPIFVIDAYTRRILDRLGVKPKSDTYQGYQDIFMSNLPHDAVLFNEYHALLVCLGKNACRKRPLCAKCCIKEICEHCTGTGPDPVDQKVAVCNSLMSSAKICPDVRT